MRYSWKGNLRVGKVSLPLRLARAVHEDEVPMSLRCPEHDASMKEIVVCPVDQAEMTIADCDRGFPRGGQRQVRIRKRELDALPREGEQYAEILETRDWTDFDWRLLKEAYLVESEAGTRRMLASLCKALENQALIAVGRMVIRGRFVPCALITKDDKTITLYTLHWPNEVEAERSLQAEANDDQVDNFEHYLVAVQGEGAVLRGEANPHIQRLRALVERKIEEMPVEVRQVRRRKRAVKVVQSDNGVT